MNIVVCVKQIPDPSAPPELNSDYTLKRDGKLIMDESDSFGVEVALQLRDAAQTGEVTLISMAPNQEVSGLHKALAMGADKAILVSDDNLHGADALSTAKVLAKCVERSGAFDLVITATESTDGYTGTVPAQIAQLLGLPCLTFAKEVTPADGMVTIRRQTEAGYDTVKAPMPAVISVTAGVVEPRYPSFKGIMAAKKKPLEILALADLGLDLGAKSWRQEVTEVVDAAERAAGVIVEDDGSAFEKIVEFLAERKVI